MLRSTKVTVALLFVAYAIDYIDRLAINLALPLLGEEFDLDYSQRGLIISTFFIAYNAGPTAWWTARRSIRRSPDGSDRVGGVECLHRPHCPCLVVRDASGCSLSLRSRAGSVSGSCSKARCRAEHPGATCHCHRMDEQFQRRRYASCHRCCGSTSPVDRLAWNVSGRRGARRTLARQHQVVAPAGTSGGERPRSGFLLGQHAHRTSLPRDVALRLDVLRIRLRDLGDVVVGSVLPP